MFGLKDITYFTKTLFFIGLVFVFPPVLSRRTIPSFMMNPQSLKEEKNLMIFSRMILLLL
jgi:hypothetical protein